MTGSHDRMQTFKLDQRGLARVFGELEAAVMDAVWALGEATVADVCAFLGDGAHYKTVMTVLNRLVDKGALSRRRESRAFRYTAVESREDFEQRISRRVVDGLLEDFRESALAQFVDAVDAVDPELLARLAVLVRERTAREGE